MVLLGYKLWLIDFLKKLQSFLKLFQIFMIIFPKKLKQLSMAKTRLYNTRLSKNRTSIQLMEVEV